MATADRRGPRVETPNMADVPLGDKFRLRFAKTGDLRLVSHHDLMRCAERLLRRADLPFRVTQGFHPTPRIVFALSLPLGVVGRAEVVEIELATPHAAADVLDRLNRAAPAGLTFLSAAVVPLKASAVPRRVVYSLAIPEELCDAARREADLFLAAEKVWVDKLHPRPRRVNVRPYVRGITIGAANASERLTPSQDGQPIFPGSEPLTCVRGSLTLDLWVTGQGTARAEDLVRLLGLGDVLANGGVLERVALELRDETPADIHSPGSHAGDDFRAGSRDAPPDGPPETAPLDHAPAAVAAGGEDDPAGPGTWGLSPSGPEVE